MTKLTIKMIDDLMAGRLDKGAAEGLEDECVYFTRRVLEAQAKGGKMTTARIPEKTRKAGAAFALGASLSNEYSWPDYMGDLWGVMHAAAPDMLGETEG